MVTQAIIILRVQCSLVLPSCDRLVKLIGPCAITVIIVVMIMIILINNTIYNDNYNDDDINVNNISNRPNDNNEMTYLLLQQQP